jgi:signal transduction histidine kinase
MKPLLLDNQDITTLAELGRASLQIVHDLKNQINGLKLYATFLRKRMERSQRPQDEQETVKKLISGLDRAAGDMTTLVRLGRPIQLRRSRVDLGRILSEVLRNVPEFQISDTSVIVEGESASLQGDFDAQALSEALKAVTEGAVSLARIRGEDSPLSIHLRLDSGDDPSAIIEWRGVIIHDGADPFHSLNGSAGLRLALAAKIIEAHGGSTDQEADKLRVRLKLSSGNVSMAAS